MTTPLTIKPIIDSVDAFFSEVLAERYVQAEYDFTKKMEKARKKEKADLPFEEVGIMTPISRSASGSLTKRPSFLVAEAYQAGPSKTGSPKLN